MLKSYGVIPQLKANTHNFHMAYWLRMNNL